MAGVLLHYAGHARLLGPTIVLGMFCEWGAVRCNRRTLWYLASAPSYSCLPAVNMWEAGELSDFQEDCFTAGGENA